MYANADLGKGGVEVDKSVFVARDELEVGFVPLM